MKTREILSRLESMGVPARKKHNIKMGAGENQFGVKLGDLRKVAKEIGTDQRLALDLWKTDNAEAQLVAILIMDLKAVSLDDIRYFVPTAAYSQVADWLNSYVIGPHPQKQELRAEFMSSADPMTARAGWTLTSSLINKKAYKDDLAALLNRIEAEMVDADPLPQWTMNTALASVGIHYPEYREIALTIGERLGVYRDYPTSKGCTSPYAPTWINFMVDRLDG